MKNKGRDREERGPNPSFLSSVTKEKAERGQRRDHCSPLFPFLSLLTKEKMRSI
jgi:hypothetical protein